MTRVLPPHPNVDHLKNEAKTLLKNHQSGDAAICKTLRRLHRFRDATDEQILAAKLALNEAQFALAMDYGFKNWDDLRLEVLRITRKPGPEEVKPRPGAYLLKDPPHGRNGISPFGYGYFLSLRYCGAACDYHTIMGDTGLAFILQADTKHPAWGKPVDQLDIGWWPLDSWGALMRVDFLGKAAGVDFRVLRFNEGEYLANPAEHYERYFQDEVVKALHSGRPPVAVEGCGAWVVTGYDDGAPPLLGQVSRVDERKTKRPKEYPWNVIIPGQSVQPMDRQQVDCEAMQFAVAMIHDRLGKLAPTNKLSGKKAFAFWAGLLRDPEGWGVHFYHANVVGHLRLNRKSAAPYLRTMAERHKKPAASHLLAAAGIYEDVPGELAKADTSKEVMAAADGREMLAKLVERIAALEAKAVNEMEKALAAME